MEAENITLLIDCGNGQKHQNTSQTFRCQALHHHECISRWTSTDKNQSLNHTMCLNCSKSFDGVAKEACLRASRAKKKDHTPVFVYTGGHFGHHVVPVGRGNFPIVTTRYDMIATGITDPQIGFYGLGCFFAVVFILILISNLRHE